MPHPLIRHRHYPSPHADNSTYNDVTPWLVWELIKERLIHGLVLCQAVAHEDLKEGVPVPCAQAKHLHRHKDTTKRA